MIPPAAMDNRELRLPAEAKPANWDAEAPLSPCLPQRGRMRRAVTWWRTQLGTVAVLNLALWSLSAAAVSSRQTPVHAGHDVASQVQLLLSAVYVLGCAFRSLLPIYDIPRIVLVDSPLSSVIIGRSVATIAELCFSAQWALLVHRAALSSHSPFGELVSLAIVPLIVLAEACSWHAVLTTAQQGHIIENSLWGLSAALVVTGLWVIGFNRFADLHPQMISWSLGGAAYTAFIFVLDVPMYWSRWRADRVRGCRCLGIGPGIIDTCQRRVVSNRWEDWKSEMLWMSLYFSFGVWSSISLVYASAVLATHGY